MALAALPFGLAIGLSVGLLGGGGSVLAVPVLVYVLGQGVGEATTTSLVVVAAGALAGGLGHAREGSVCWRHALVFSATALPGVIAGTVLGEAVGGATLIAAFAVLMLAAAITMWHKFGAQGGDRGDRGSAPGCPPLRLERDLVAGLAIGLLTGFFGVGGGFLVVPTLALALALSMRLAIGTSLVIITTISLLGFVVHLAAGRELDPGVTVAMTSACVLGAAAGAALTGRIPQRQLGRGFAVLIAGVAAYLLVSAAFLGGPPAS